MKRIPQLPIVVGTLLLPLFSTAQQYQYGFQKEYFFARQPSARSEAMGKSMVALDGDLQAMYFNPAAAGTIHGVEVNGNYATPFYLADKASFQAVNAGWRVKDYLSVALSFSQFSINEEITLTNQNGEIVSKGSGLAMQNFGLTVAGQPLKKLYVGASLGYYFQTVGDWNDPLSSGSALLVDFGALKRFDFLQRARTAHFATLGASITNLSDSKMEIKTIFSDYTTERALPITARYGLSYGFIFDTGWLSDTLQTFQLIAQGEFQDVLNSEYETAGRVGAELQLFELLALRIGFYDEKVYDYGNSEVNRSHLRSLTYGVGLQLPLYKLSRVPLNIRIDFTRFQQPLYTYEEIPYFKIGKFSSVGVKVAWML